MKPTVALIERACRTAWSPADTTTIGGWVLVRNGGFTRRLNSSSAVGPASTDLATREAIDSWITGDRGANAPIRVTPLSHGPTMDEAARRWGLVPVDETLVLIRDAQPTSTADDGVVMTPVNAPSFIDDVVALNGYGNTNRAPLQGIVGRIEFGTGLWMPGAAVAVAGIVESVCCVFSLAVTPAARGRGLASAVVARAGAWGNEHGARHVTLQVLGTNAPARRLYDRLGFETAYAYHYLEPRPASSLVS